MIEVSIRLHLWYIVWSYKWTRATPWSEFLLVRLWLVGDIVVRSVQRVRRSAFLRTRYSHVCWKRPRLRTSAGQASNWASARFSRITGVRAVDSCVRARRGQSTPAGPTHRRRRGTACPCNKYIVDTTVNDSGGCFHRDHFRLQNRSRICVIIFFIIANFEWP